MEVQASLRATTKQSSTLENYAKRFSVAASINRLSCGAKAPCYDIFCTGLLRGRSQ